MTDYGYMRVSTKKQGSRFGLERQKDALISAGIEPQNLYSDEISGAKKNRPALDELRGIVESGDSITCVSMDRLGRDTLDTITLIESLREKGVAVHFLKEGIDTSKNDAMTNCFIGIMACFAQLEREQMLERQEMAYESMRARGKQIGRPKSPEDKIEAAISLVNEGKSYREVSKIVGLSPAKICQEMKKHRTRQQETI